MSTLSATKSCQCEAKFDSLKSSANIDGRKIQRGLSVHDQTAPRTRPAKTYKAEGAFCRGRSPECSPRRPGVYRDMSDEEEVDTLYDSIPCRNTPDISDSGMGLSRENILSHQHKTTVEVGTCMSRGGSVRYDRLKDATFSVKQTGVDSAAADSEYNVFEARSVLHEPRDLSDNNDADISDYENGSLVKTESFSNQTNQSGECSDREINVYAKVRKKAVILGVNKPTPQDTQDVLPQVAQPHVEPSIDISKGHTESSIDEGESGPSSPFVRVRKNSDQLRLPRYLAKHIAPRDSGVGSVQNSPRTSQLSNPECSTSNAPENKPQSIDVSPELAEPDTENHKPESVSPISDVSKLAEPRTELEYDKLYDRDSCSEGDYEDDPVHDDRVANIGYAPGSSEDTLMTGNQCVQRPGNKLRSNISTVRTTTGRVNPTKPHVTTKGVAHPQVATQSNQSTVDQTVPQVFHRTNPTIPQGQGAAGLDYEDSYLTTDRETSGCEEFTVAIDSAGGNFRSRLLQLSGSIPEGAVSPDQTVSLRFVGSSPENYQNQVPSAMKFVSRIYHFLPHGITFEQAVMLRFTHGGQTRPRGPRTRLRLMYSETGPSEDTDWKLFDPTQIIDTQKGMKVLLTESCVCLFLTRFCLFGVVQEEVPSRFTDVAVYGKYYPYQARIMLTVHIGTRMQSELEQGKLIATGTLLVCADIDEIIVTMPSAIDNVVPIQCPRLKQKLHSHYVMNEKPCKAIFLLRPEKTCDFLNCFITIEHLEKTEIYIIGALTELDIPGCGRLCPPSTPRCHTLQPGGRAESERSHANHEINLEYVEDCAVKRRLSNDLTASKNSDFTCTVLDNDSKTPVHGEDHAMMSTVTAGDIAKRETVQRHAGEGESISGDYSTDVAGTFQNIHDVPAQQHALVQFQQEQQMSEVASCKKRDWPQQVGNHGPCTINVYHNYTNCSTVDYGPLSPGNKKYLTKPKLSHETKIKLGQKLDLEIPSGEDWRAFAGVLGYDGHLHQFGENATYKLLQIWENIDGDKGSLMHLVHCLERINRRDAAQLVRQEFEQTVSMC